MSTFSRRDALRAVAGAAAGLAVASPALTGVAQAATDTAPAKHTATGPAPFDEIYQGRHIQGAPSHGGHHGGHHDVGYTVHIDGEELHLMRNADGTWISILNHYEPVATPRAVTRAAVRELQGAALAPLATA